MTARPTRTAPRNGQPKGRPGFARGIRARDWAWDRTACRIDQGATPRDRCLCDPFHHCERAAGADGRRDRRRRHHLPADRRPAEGPTPSTRWSSTRPSAPGRSTTTTPSSARACWSTSARWSSHCPRRSRCRSRCARSTRACSSTPKPSEPTLNHVPGGVTRAADTPLTGAVAVPRVVLGVSGGIAAYKSRDRPCGCCTRKWSRRHGRADRPALRSSAPPPSGAVRASGSSGLGPHPRAPRATGRDADLVVVAPATADLLARAADGLADDLLTATLLVATAPRC